MARYTNQQIADYLHQGYWNDQPGESPHHFHDDTISVDMTSVGSDTNRVVRNALERWEEVADIQFDIGFHNNDAQLNFFEPSGDGGDGEVDAFTSVDVDAGDNRIKEANVTIDRDFVSNNGGTTLTSQTYETYIHEIGHALGLGHAGDYNGSATYGDDNLYENDSEHVTVMSYFNQRENTSVDADWANNVTPMIADMLAIRDIYGLDPDTRDGDTTYGYNHEIQGQLVGEEAFDAPSNSGVLPSTYTIYDTGGHDTIDMSGASVDQEIRLEQQAVSDVDGVAGAVTIGPDTVIEDAIGGSGDDSIIGNAANNTLTGNDGADVLSGEDGSDRFRYVDGQNADSGESILGKSGFDSLFVTASGNRTFDLTELSAGSIEQIAFADDGAEVDKKVTLSASEFETGSGFVGDLEVDGNDARDSTDTVRIEMDDTATLDLSNWSFDDWGDQDDRVKVFADDAPHTITGSAVADSLFGGDGSDRIDPGLGTDYVDAGAGFDEVDGGELRGDEDRLFGGTDTDLLSYEDERFDDARIDLEDGEAISSGLAPDKDQFAGFENLNDASGGNTLQGTDDANVIRGFEGNDTLDGRGGDDVLKGGAGDDRVLFDDDGTDGDSNHGGPGEDTIDGNGVTFGDATFDLGANEYDAGQYTETWQRFENYDNAGGSGAEEVIGASGPNEITTGSGDNRLVGGGGQDDLSAGAGDDTLVGGVDGDRLDGGPGSDTASYTGSNAVQVNLGFDTARGGDAEGDTLHGIENLTGSPAADRLAGDSSANTLIGAGDPDTLVGGDDADRLVGGEGADDLDGGKGDDDLDGGPGGDTFFAKGGSDTLDYADSDAAVDVDLDREQASGGHAEGDTIAPTLDGRLGALDFEPAENILGSDHSDTLRGDARENRLEGGDGADTLKGHDGKDELIGGAGNDTIQGGATDADLRDRVFAGAGDDEADGGAGNDELRGDAGNDTLAGGQGADDVIGGADDDVMTGSGFSDLLFGGPGFDFVNGGFGYDRVNGGDGGDRFFHTGTEGHASDWIQDYDAGEGDVLQYGGNASPEDFQVNTTEKQDSGEAGVEEAFVIHRPSGQILWALVDGAGQDSIDLRIDGQTHDLLG